MRLVIDPTTETGFRLVRDGDPMHDEIAHKRSLLPAFPADGTVRGVVDVDGFVWVEVWGGSSWHPIGAPAGRRAVVSDTAGVDEESFAWGDAPVEGDVFVNRADNVTKVLLADGTWWTL